MKHNNEADIRNFLKEADCQLYAMGIFDVSDMGRTTEERYGPSLLSELAEMTGGRPNVPDDPSLDVATIKAPVATYRLDATSKQKQVEFSDRDSEKVFKIWTVSFSEDGRVTGAMNEDYATYVAHIVRPPSPPGTVGLPSSPPSRVIQNPPQPAAKVTHVPPSMQ